MIEKKLKKPYPYLAHGYLNKGILIVEICDLAFSGFKNDPELTKTVLDCLKKEIEPLIANSSFNKIVLVDALSGFHLNPEELMYKLF